jgi:hypothetical protein
MLFSRTDFSEPRERIATEKLSANIQDRGRIGVAPIPTFSPNTVGGEGAEDFRVATL